MFSPKSMFLPLLAITLLTSTCKKKELIPGCYTGQPTVIGSGKAMTWADFNTDGFITSMGIILTDAALESLSASTTHTNPNHSANVFEMQFPPNEVTGTPFNNCVINWNPIGHTAPVYNKPHL